MAVSTRTESHNTMTDSNLLLSSQWPTSMHSTLQIDTRQNIVKFTLQLQLQLQLDTLG